jgi:dipeptidyl aminopeptidase/acylaminoacyl peptidase
MLVRIEAHIMDATSLAFSPDGAMLVTGGRDGTVKLWLANSGAFVKTVYTGSNLVEAVQFSPSGELLAVTLDNLSVALVQTNSGNVIDTLPSLVRMTVHTDAERNNILTVSGESSVWPDAENSTPLGLHVVGQNNRSAAVVLSPDGAQLASTSTDGLILLWRIVDITIFAEDYDHEGNDLISRFITGSLLFTLSGHTEWATQLDFSSDGRYLVSASRDGTLILWSLDKGVAAAVLTGHDGPVNTLDVSPDDTLIASGSDDGTVRIWALGGE